MAEPRKKKPVEDDDVQKVVLEDVGPKAKAAHEKAVKSTILTEKVLLGAFAAMVALATFGQMVMQYQLAKTAAIKVEEVAVKAEEVKETLDESNRVTDEKLDSITKTTEENKKTGEAVHVLVNANMGAQLKISMIALKRVAELTKNADDIAAAELAEKLFHEHESKQGTVDDREAKDKAHKESRTRRPGDCVRFCSAIRASPKSRSGVALTV